MIKFKDVRSGPVGAILMTALPPSIGHEALVRFGAEYMSHLDGHLVVIMGVLPNEPGRRADHFEALRSCFGSYRNVHFSLQFSNDPQGPSGPDDDAFWAHWVKVIMGHIGKTPDYLFSSEQYGFRMAQALDCQHIPFDPGRWIANGVKATDIRNDITGQFFNIIKPLRDELRMRVTIFGPESTGKTTLTKNLGEHYNSPVSPEWARPYLEMLPDGRVNQERERMLTIVRGQAAQEAVTDRMAEDKGSPFAFFDTDLLTTMGFEQRRRPRFGRNKLVSWEHDERAKWWDEIEGLYRPADLYLVTSDAIPFEVDPLRYGGDKRETDAAYWIGILEARQLPYYVIPTGDALETLGWAIQQLENAMEARAGFAYYERTT